eukprot:g10105.t1
MRWRPHQLHGAAALTRCCDIVRRSWRFRRWNRVAGAKVAWRWSTQAERNGNTGRFAWLMLMWRRGQLNWRTFHDLVDENVKSAENLIADERSASGAVDKEHV